MAVIEEESNGADTSKLQPNSATRPSGYASDGYETASDTELNDSLPENGSGPVTEPNDSVPENDCGPGTEPNLSVPENASDPGVKNGDDDKVSEKALAEASDAKLEGNSLFKAGQYEEALSKYEIAIRVAPDDPSSNEMRAICHANRAACFSKLGKYEETIKECTKALELNPTYMKSLLRRAEAREKLEQYEESIADLTKILELDPSIDEARRSISRLKPLADEKREKMKEEMIGKLKEMGNSILGRFGMSVDNFKAVKDPNTGSYSISFQN